MRGLTLIEVLAAVALLAVLAAATLPWITDARRLSAPQALGIEPEALGDLADAVLEDPEAFALPPLLEVGEVPLSAATVEGQVFTVRRVDIDVDEPTHAWLVFECGGHMTARSIRLPREPGP